MPGAQLARFPHRASSPVPVLVPRAGPRTLAASVLSLQRSVGNAGVVLLLASSGAHRRVDRQPRDPWEENQPPDSGPQRGDERGMTGCSVVRKDGGWHVKCEHESGRSTPAIPTDPGKIGDMVPKEERKTPLGPLTDAPQGPWLRRPTTVDDICKANPKAPVCINLGTTAPPWLDLPVGEFYSFDVLYEHNQPAKPQGGTTAPGAATLDWIVKHLEADPTLQVRLVGHASSEGTPAENLQLSIRRAQSLNAALAAKGLGARVMDFVGGQEPAGCKRLELGVWACGAAQAATGEARPEDRKVAVTFLRNAPAHF